MSDKNLSRIVEIEGMEHVMTMKNLFKDVDYENHLESVPPFHLSNSDIMVVESKDDQVCDTQRQVSRGTNVTIA